MTDRTAWECPNCSRWHAPHVDVCDCVPAPAPTDPPTTEEMFALILEELHKLEAAGFNWRYLPVPYVPSPPIYVYPPPQPVRITPYPSTAPWLQPTIISTTTSTTDSTKNWTTTAAQFDDPASIYSDQMQ